MFISNFGKVNLPKLDSLEEDFREEAELPRRALNIA